MPIVTQALNGEQFHNNTTPTARASESSKLKLRQAAALFILSTPIPSCWISTCCSADKNCACSPVPTSNKLTSSLMHQENTLVLSICSIVLIWISSWCVLEIKHGVFNQVCDKPTLSFSIEIIELMLFSCWLNSTGFSIVIVHLVRIITV